MRSILLTLAITVSPLTVMASEFKAELGVQAQLFTEDAAAPTHQSNSSLSLQPSFTHEFDERDIYFTFTQFVRWDKHDDERTHSDIRELKILKVIDDWELEAGIGKVFWGVAEANHLVDIINQTDYLENLDGEDKLGQPMLRISKTIGQSTLSIFALPYFRERDYLGEESRFALPFDVESSDAIFESSEEEKHIDYALRFSGYIDQLDYGVSWFDGTSRDAQLLPSPNTQGEFVPYYQQIKQLSVEMQYTIDAWLWKFEAIHQKYNDDKHSAMVVGFEYTLYGQQDGLYDLGLLMEYNYDSRDDAQSVLMQDDVFVGARLGFTDVQSSSILAGVIHDLDDDSRSIRIEASRRVFDDATLTLDAQVFSNVDADNITYSIRDNDFVLMELSWFF